MISPDQANALKPDELVWLKAMEERIDKKLLEQYATNYVDITLKEPPFARTMRLLQRQYIQAGWSVSAVGGSAYRFQPQQTPPEPTFPTQREMTAERTEVAVVQTAWERLNSTE